MFTCTFAWALYVCVPGAHRGQKRDSDPVKLELHNYCEPACGCWASKPDLPQEQQAL